MCLHQLDARCGAHRLSSMRMKRILFVFAALAVLACATPVHRSPTSSAAAPQPVAEPASTSVDAWLKALNVIDARIVGGHNREAMIGRGLNTCADIRDGKSAEDVAIRTNKRFTAPEAPDGFGLATARRIVLATHQWLCPQYVMAT